MEPHLIQKIGGEPGRNAWIGETDGSEVGVSPRMWRNLELAWPSGYPSALSRYRLRLSCVATQPAPIRSNDTNEDYRLCWVPFRPGTR